jgi:Fur family ferric uptake transcriptional regulator
MMEVTTRSHSHPQQELSARTGRLRLQARKITGPRQAILEILRGNFHPMTNKAVFAALPKGDGDLATVYRSMRLLEDLGMVKRFDFGDGVARYELLREGDDGHHHHLVCTGCAEIIEIEDCSMRELEEQIAVRNGFKAVTHKLEFFGLCPQCQ